MRGLVRALFIACTICTLPTEAADPSARFVYPDASGKLVYDHDAGGNRIVDFSYAGYMDGGRAIPAVHAIVRVEPSEHDSTKQIQAAIDYVSSLPLDKDGRRGAVQLAPGIYRLQGRLRIQASGVILRGIGAAPKETILLAIGHDRTSVIRILGQKDRRVLTELQPRMRYVPSGSRSLKMESSTDIAVGDEIEIVRPSTKEWIAAIGNRFPTDDRGSWLDWRPGTVDVCWHRVIENVDSESITLNAPITEALDPSLGKWTLAKMCWPGRIEQVGIENIAIESEHDDRNPLDEDHAWSGISIENARDCWVRSVHFRGLAGSAIAVWETGSRITVCDCHSTAPVSEVAGYRRHTFYTNGGQTLFFGCSAADGRHDFSVGHLAPGPNVFAYCRADRADQFSGPIESWASGVLYDNINMDGGGIALTDRETQQQGVGWTGTNSVLWQCSAPIITCRKPPLGNNWAIGCWGEFVGDGYWRSMNEFVAPQSLFEAQRLERGLRFAIALRDTKEADAAEKATVPVPKIEEILESASVLPNASSGQAPNELPIELVNGWLVRNGELLVGGRANTVWWRGSVLPSRAGELGIGVTRFVPGREGPGYTDDLRTLARELCDRRVATLEHHWGLWYDRRRDDHQMIRRIDGDAWPPFYEQPWARSGRGRAWDGLSKYDLTRFNPWYFSRLQAIAREFSANGQLLWLHMYFQHNILEAGAHWADFPWRSANCWQDVGFPEPPPYVNNKRIFMADQFYDTTHPVRRDLHQRYIKHCLDQLGNSRNVVFSLGEEFTGPVDFVRFWLDTVAQWRQQTGKSILVSLGCTKDVQDAILADPRLTNEVDIIEQKYWWYTKDGGLYAPAGGTSQSPRQQWREFRGEKGISPESTVRQVSEYRLKYPGKAVVLSSSSKASWAAAVAGASVVELPRKTPPELLRFFAAALPIRWPINDSKVIAALASRETEEQLVLVTEGSLPPAINSDVFTCSQVDLQTGELRPCDESFYANRSKQSEAHGPALYWIRKLRD